MATQKMVNDGFKKLNEAGYHALQDHMCCMSCGWANIPDDKADKAVFYHNQDTERFKESGRIYLTWSGDGNEIKSILESVGLIVTWDGTESKKIMIS